MTRWLPAAGVFLVCTACPTDIDSIVGAWAREDNRPRLQEFLYLEEDGTGRHELSAQFEGGSVENTSTILWTRPEEDADAYELILECEGFVLMSDDKVEDQSCLDISDVILDCLLTSEPPQLDCSTPKTGVFAFERVEE